MFIKKCVFVYYRLVFKLYGKLGRICLAKAKKNPTRADIWFEITDWCIRKRQDILRKLKELTRLN